MPGKEVPRDPAKFPDYTEKFTLEALDASTGPAALSAQVLKTVDLPDSFRKGAEQ